MFTKLLHFPINSKRPNCFYIFIKDKNQEGANATRSTLSNLPPFIYWIFVTFLVRIEASTTLRRSEVVQQQFCPDLCDELGDHVSLCWRPRVLSCFKSCQSRHITFGFKFSMLLKIWQENVMWSSKYFLMTIIGHVCIIMYKHMHIAHVLCVPCVSQLLREEGCKLVLPSQLNLDFSLQHDWFHYFGFKTLKQKNLYF